MNAGLVWHGLLAVFHCLQASSATHTLGNQGNRFLRAA